jgi:hypothetical protein
MLLLLMQLAQQLLWALVAAGGVTAAAAGTLGRAQVCQDVIDPVGTIAVRGVGAAAAAVSSAAVPPRAPAPGVLPLAAAGHVVRT